MCDIQKKLELYFVISRKKYEGVTVLPLNDIREPFLTANICSTDESEIQTTEAVILLLTKHVGVLANKYFHSDQLLRFGSNIHKWWALYTPSMTIICALRHSKLAIEQ